MAARSDDPATRDLRFLQSDDGAEADQPAGADDPADAARASEADAPGVLQGGAQGDPLSSAVVGIEELASEPIFDSPAHVMWAGVIAVLAVMFLLFFVMMRGRATRRRSAATAKTDFFAPPEDDAQDSRFTPRRSDRDDYDDERAAEEAVVVRVDESGDEPRARRAGLFGSKKGDDGKPDRARKEGFHPPDRREAPGEDRREARRHDRGEDRRDDRSDDRRAELGAMRQDRMDPVASGRMEHEFRRLSDRLEERMGRFEEAARRMTETRAGGEDLYGLIAGVEDALTAQSEMLKADTRNLLEEFASALDRRLEDTPLAGGDRLAGAMDGAGGDVLGEIDRLLASHEQALAREFETLRSMIDHGGVNELRDEIARLRDTLGGRASGAAAPRIQLIDAMQRALPASAYQINAPIDSRGRADAVIRLAPKRPPIAVDAQFPLEIYDEYLRTKRNAESDPYGNERESRRAEQEFRRMAVGHVVDVAERMIRPPRTVDGALLFLPSEDLYGELQANFPDVLHDAMRARVWIVTPASFTASLNIVRALFHAGGAADDAEDGQRVASALDDLRRHVERIEARLPEGAPGAMSDVSSGASSGPMSRPMSRPMSGPMSGAGRPDRLASAMGDRHQAAPPAGPRLGERRLAAGASRTPYDDGAASDAPESGDRRMTDDDVRASLGAFGEETREPDGSRPAVGRDRFDATRETRDDVGGGARPPETSYRGEPRTFTEPYASSLWSTQATRGDEGDLEAEGEEFGRSDAASDRDGGDTDERRFPLR
ncbi:MAG: DNA recombination protein RmuC [Alphaproteobacteria bacterium]|nr:DNA recombination protein RmuC [Alphaproteobacteria bacterium]